MIAIINYGLGNLGSIQNMLRKIGSNDVVITSDVTQIDKADKLILPGVGAFDSGMQKINDSGLLDTLNRNVLNKKKPVLGICLGMQLLTNGSEEGALPGLGWIDAMTKRFAFEPGQNLKVPHMGWNEITISKQHPLSQNLYEPSKYYFVHTYHVVCNHKEDELMRCHYGIDFTAAVQRDNIMGVQFHPEKSHKFGMRLLQNFIAI